MGRKPPEFSFKVAKCQRLSGSLQRLSAVCNGWTAAFAQCTVQLQDRHLSAAEAQALHQREETPSDCCGHFHGSAGSFFYPRNDITAMDA